MTQLDFTPRAARAYLASGDERIKRAHDTGLLGVEACSQITELRDTATQRLLQTALAELGEDGRHDPLAGIALVAHGGYGRGDLAPFSDIDLMILHDEAASDRAARVAAKLFRDLFDSGLLVGHSVRTPADVCRLAGEDPATCTSLVESRRLWGDVELFQRFENQFRRQFQPNARPMLKRIVRSRRDECHRFGDTVFLLQPNLKQSLGGLRDLQLLRWGGFLRYGSSDPEALAAEGILSADDVRVIRSAHEFLLRLRNELHFYAGRAVDVLDRAEQVRIAALRGYENDQSLLPVELFMRDYFRHTAGVSHVVGRFVAKAQSRERIARLATAVFGHRVEGGVRVGISGMFLTGEGLAALRGNWVEVMRVVALSSLYDKPIVPATWEAIRREAGRLPEKLPLEAYRRFLSLLARPTRLGILLADLHDAGILGRFIPEFDHARGLLQFNQYHKYTVDVHCLRAVDFAASLQSDNGPLGRAYRNIKRKHVLHLALLLHDLGKAFSGNHQQLGERIADRTAARLGMLAAEAETLRFLVRYHDLMNHLAFRRDTNDERLVFRFIAEVGSPERLQMLYVLTAADLAAVGPRVWDAWKSEVLSDLHQRAMACLAGGGESGSHASPTTCSLDALSRLLDGSVDPARLAEQLERLPPDYLAASNPEQVAGDLQLLQQIDAGKVVAAARYRSDTQTVQFTVGASERARSGIFHRLTGVLSANGLEIRSAEIHTLCDGAVLDHFCVHDPDYAGEPPRDRVEQVKAELIQSLLGPEGKTPAFRRVWQSESITPLDAGRMQTRVEIDNATSEKYTILDVFAPDRPGLLHAAARSLFMLDLSVARARISTFAHQVVDVLYVTDRQGEKIIEQPRLEAIKTRLLDVIRGESEAY